MQVGLGHHGRHGARDGDPDLGSVQQRQIVFRVADRDRVVRGQAQLVQCREQPGSLGHPGRKDHRRASVVHHLAVQAEAGNHVHGPGGILPVQRKHHAAGVGGNTPVSQRRSDRSVEGACQRPQAGSGVQHGAVLGDDRVKMAPEAGERLLQVTGDPPRHQDHPQLSAASLDGIHRTFGQTIILG